MSTLLFLDTSVLGMITNAKGSTEAYQCYEWFEAHWASGSEAIRIIVPEIADYELRRKLLHISAAASIARLDALETEVEYAPITTEVMVKTAAYWAHARKEGRPTAAEEALDGDVILAAQAALMQGHEERSLIATTNVKHLEMFVDACIWDKIHLC